MKDAVIAGAGVPASGVNSNHACMDLQRRRIVLSKVRSPLYLLGINVRSQRTSLLLTLLG